MLHLGKLKLVSAGIAALALGLMLFSFAGAQTEAEDTASVTVTPKTLAIADLEGGTFGDVAKGDTQDTTSSGSGDDVTFNNPTTSVPYSDIGIEAVPDTDNECISDGTDWDLVDTMANGTDTFTLDAAFGNPGSDDLTGIVEVTQDNAEKSLGTEAVPADAALLHVDLKITLSTTITSTDACTISLLLTAHS